MAAALAFWPLPGHALECPKMPEQARKDWEVEVKAAVGKIGPARGADLETRTRTATQDLMGKLPQADKVYLEQMMYATYCSALRDDASLAEAEKALRIRAYNFEVRRTLHGSPPPPPNPGGRGSRTPSSTDSEAARLQLAQLSLPYKPETFVERVRAGDLYAVKLFLAAGMDPNARDESRDTALIRAVSEGRMPIIQALLKANASVDEKGRSESTALSGAAASGNKDIVRLLLARSPNTETVNGAFLAAARGLHLEVLRLLLAKGVDVKEIGADALRSAAHTSLVDVKVTETVRFILDLGVDANARTKEGWSALHLAAHEGNAGVVRILLDRGAAVDLVCECLAFGEMTNMTALQMAAHKSHREAIATLVANGANVHHRNGKGATALHLAAEGGDGAVGIVADLLAKGADVKARDDADRTPVMLVRSVAVMRALLDAGGEVNAQDRDRWTSLMYHAYRPNADAVRLLLDRGADVNLAGDNGTTALMIAVRRAPTSVVRALLQAGALVNSKNADGKTALDLAAEIPDERDRRDTLRLLTSAAK